MNHASDHGFSIEGQLPASAACDCDYCLDAEGREGVRPSFAGRFVNVYLEDRAYGGPEEGGWWYDYGELVSSTQSRPDGDHLERDLRRARAWCEEENAHRMSDVSSVISEGRYVARAECGPGRDYPTERPRYE